jgi:DNA-directed RNA polymerase subunit RPC12/RpoP
MSKFRTVAIFSYPAEAVVVKGKLESEDIQVYLKDEFTVASDPFATNAIGGVKMLVYKEDFIKAMGIIEQSNPDLVKHRVDYVKCPKCGKRDARETIDVSTARTFGERATAVFYSLFPLKQKQTFQCKNCNHKFNVDE